MKLVPNAVSVAAARMVLKTQKNSPHLLFAAGIVGMGATVVLACKATLKVEDILADHESKTHRINNLDVAPSDVDELKTRSKVELSIALGKLYAPAVVTGIVSVSALAGSHNILSKRNAALTTAYGLVANSFEQYRKRVRDAYGDERELEIYEDVQDVEVQEVGTNKTKKLKQATGGSPYSFLFGPQNANYERAPEYNFMFLKMMQEQHTQRLQARGHLFLNEVLYDLGLEHTKEGAVTGWIKGSGDDYVDYGIFNADYEERIIEFMIGREEAIWLSFNVAGTIYDKI